MTKLSELHKQWMDDPQYQKGYHSLEAEFNLAQTLIETRTKIGLTQEAFIGNVIALMVLSLASMS